MKKLPLKMRVIQWMGTNREVSAEDIIKALQEEYGTEKQLCIANMTHMLQAMKAVGIIAMSGVAAKGEDDVEVKYSITEYGLSRMKYIPNHR